MNPEQYMILIDGADKTREIESVDYDPAENRMAVKYYKSSKIYKYRCDRVQKFDEPKEIDLKDKAAIYWSIRYMSLKRFWISGRK